RPDKPGKITMYQMLICKQWQKFPALGPYLLEQALYIAKTLAGEAVQSLNKILRSAKHEDYYNGKLLDKQKELWRWVGTVLDALCYVPTGDGKLYQAVQGAAEDIEKVWEATAAQMKDWERKTMAEEVLGGVLNIKR